MIFLKNNMIAEIGRADLYVMALNSSLSFCVAQIRCPVLLTRLFLVLDSSEVTEVQVFFPQ
jgi:hypothetical protein